ncbi:OmpP1/FadL family transporter [Gymnodinialimonas hymeniacidonis]|uniref:OmpP1/FadL family transporter n=1 Tax=Gymnodinialimonas hymeniacidonis TaxID=3126508 RepID=UPI0034C60DB4
MTRYTLTAAAALLASTSIASAGGIDRAAPSTSILFEEGTYVEIGYSFADPEISGAVNGAPLNSGDIGASFSSVSVRYRQDLTDELSFALIFDQPYGASVDYPTGTGYPFAGSTAEITSQQLTGVLRYQINENVSVYGGLRALRATGDAYVSAGTAFTYYLDSESEWALGYMVGAAYEMPEIALRVALTYYSGIDLTLEGVETPGAAGTPEAGLAAAAPATSFEVNMPQQVHLEAQSGIAEDTLLFGSVRWTDYGGFAITPNRYPTPSGNLVDYDDDVFTFALGVGRRINDEFSVSGTVGYETERGGFSGNLGPTDGVFSLGLGGEYTMGQISLAGGIQYSWIGNADTQLGGGATSTFSDNSALGVGLRVGYSF